MAAFGLTFILILTGEELQGVCWLFQVSLEGLGYPRTNLGQTVPCLSTNKLKLGPYAIVSQQPKASKQTALPRRSEYEATFIENARGRFLINRMRSGCCAR